MSACSKIVVNSENHLAPPGQQTYGDYFQVLAEVLTPQSDDCYEYPESLEQQSDETPIEKVCVFSINFFKPHIFQHYLSKINSTIQKKAREILLKHFPDPLPLCIATTGSDGRDEKIFLMSPIELIIIYKKKEDYTANKTTVKKIEDLIQEHLDTFYPSIELKYLDQSNLICYSSKKEEEDAKRDVPFPTRALDAKYIMGEVGIFTAYKTHFYDQVQDPKNTHQIQRFKNNARKPSVRMIRQQVKDFDLTEGTFYYDGEKIKGPKYPLLRSVVFTIAHLVCKLIFTKQIDTEVMSTFPSNTIERLDWLKDKKWISEDDCSNLQKAYGMSLYWFERCQKSYKTQSDQPITLSVQKSELEWVAKTILKFGETIIDFKR